MTQAVSGYTAAQVAALLKKARAEGKQVSSMTTFYRSVQDGYIRKTVPEGRVREAIYNPDDVLDFIEYGPPSKRGKRKKTRRGQQEERARQPLEVSAAEKNAATDWMQESDLSSVFQLDLDLYGLDNAVSPTITGTWWRKNPYACRILFNEHNRRDIWGVLSILPMEEATIYRLLKGEMLEREITADDILAYEPGHEYACYVASVAVRPEHKHAFNLLLNQVMAFWCDRYPDIAIKKLYAFALGEEHGMGIRLIRKLYFAPRYDLGGNAWELRLDRYNPSPIIQRFQQCLRQKLASRQQ